MKKAIVCFLSRNGVVVVMLLLYTVLSSCARGNLNINRLNCEILQVYFEHSIVNDCRLRR